MLYPNYILIVAYEPIGKTLSFRVSTDYKIKNLLDACKDSDNQYNILTGTYID